MDRVADQTDGTLLARDASFVQALLQGRTVADAKAGADLDTAAAIAALSRVIAHLQSRVGELAGTKGVGAQQDTCVEFAVPGVSDYELVREALYTLPSRAAVGLSVRYAQRLLPLAASLIDTLPTWEADRRAVDAAIRATWAYAEGGAVPSDRAALAQVMRRVWMVCSSDTGPPADVAYGCLAVLEAALRFPLEQGGEAVDIMQGLKIGGEHPRAAEALRAAAVDARGLLDSGIDLSEGLGKLISSSEINPLTALWPAGEPAWYRQEAAPMKPIAEENPQSIPTPESSSDSEVDETSPEVCIPPLAFLRSLVALFWSAFRHPFRTTEVDLSTGRIVRHY